MSDPENFLTRWSRRKHQAAEEKAAEPEAKTVSERAPQAESTPAAATEAPFDPASLPPIESLESGSDIRPFLQKNVPADLTRAALRRAWAADPAIRDFVGLSENAWDFNAPDAIPGFGPLEMTDEIRQMLADIVGEKKDASPKTASSPDLPSVETVQAIPPEENSGETASTLPDDHEATVDQPAQTADASPIARSDIAEQHANAATQQNSPRESADRPLPRGHGRALPQ